MLIEESMWLGKQLGSVESKKLSPILDLGSSTEVFRKTHQPWVGKSIYDPLEEREIVVKHLDLKPMPGVDIVGDLTDATFIQELRTRTFSSVLCANLLEHVKEPERIARALVEILPHGGYLFVSCPFRFPYHPDPIDTRFRPDVGELSNLFPSTKIVTGEIVTCSTYFNHLYPLEPRGKALLKHMIRLCLPFYGPAAWALKVLHLPWLFRRVSATCLVLKRI